MSVSSVLLLALCMAASQARFNDCHERWKAGETIPGVYEIYPNGTENPTKVYCGHSVDATYTVIQRRWLGNVNFAQKYVDYQRGFGDAQGDYWAGLDTISALTQTGNNYLRIDLSDWAGNSRYATYQTFSVLPRANYYQMFAHGFQGNVPGDDLGYQSGNYFFTYDAPDQYGCAGNMGGGGWWYYYCSYANLNGVYYQGGKYVPNPRGFYDGVYWKDWTGFDYSLRHVSMTLYRV